MQFGQEIIANFASKWLREARGQRAGSLHDGSFGSEKFVTAITPRFLGSEPCQNRSPGIFDRARRHHGLDAKQRQSGAGKQIGSPRTSRELQMPAKNAAEPQLLLRFKSCKPHGVAVHGIVVEVVVSVG